jgi:hypothetical protein
VSAGRLPRVLKKLLELNDGRDLRIAQGTRHWKICVSGRQVGIYPLTPGMEGFADNTKAQLRRAGLVVEGRRQ